MTLTGTVLCAWRVGSAVVQGRNWAQWRVADPSAAELYVLNFWFDVILAVIAAIIAVAGWRMLRSRVAR